MQAPFHLVECVMTLQRNDLMFFSVEKWGGILKRGEKTHEPPQIVRTAQKKTCMVENINFKQNTNFAFLVESVLF